MKFTEINENIRGNSVFVVQSTSDPANDNIMELLLVIDAQKILSKNHYSCHPLLWICKQDRKVAPRTSISAKVLANLITNAGATRVVTVDLHAGKYKVF